MGGYQRPEGGWRFNFGGVKTDTPADAMAATKSPYCQNVRGYTDQTLTTRPGYNVAFNAANQVTDIRAYSAINTDNQPRILARNVNNQIYLDNGVSIGTMAGALGLGACLIPFRPNNSPQSWMYISTVGDYRKASAPDVNNNVSFFKSGIAEPHSPPDASPLSFNYYSFSAVAASWTGNNLSAGPTDATRVSDTATTAIVDPASNGFRWSVQVATTKSYQIGELINIVRSGGGSYNTVVEDVLPPVNAGSTITVQSIFYYAGNTGRCVIVPTQQPAGTSIPTFSGSIPSAESIFTDSSLSFLRRGSLIRLNGTETDIVLSVSTGPDGTISFEVATSGTIAVGNTINGLPAIIVSDIAADVIGQAISAVQVNGTITGALTGSFSQTLATNPFTHALAPSVSNPQLDDYVAFQFQIDNISLLVQGVIIFDVKNGAPDYATDFYYYIFNVNNIIFPTAQAPPIAVQNNPQLFANTGNPVTITTNTNTGDPSFGRGPTAPVDSNIPAQIIEGPPFNTTDVFQPNPTVTNLTPLPTSQWATVMIPIRSLTRVGNDDTRSLINCQGVRISFQTTGTINVAISSFLVGGGGQPDVAENLPYFYSVVGRSKLTGAISNPSPITRYGLSPRRQQVYLTITDTVGDPQCDTWDIYRFGGTANSWRYIGSARNSASTVNFTDNFFDTAAIAGIPIVRDNYEPWPSIDVPFFALPGTASGITTAITVTGTTILLVYSSANPFTTPAPASILNWLPGTLITVGGQSSYTLWNRPTQVTLASPPAANYFAYLFQLVENAGYNGSANLLSVLEPNVANQHLPYIWGVDAEGTMFGVGDPLRPGTLYSSKSNAPDSAPDSYNQEICPPSEPLMGGEVANGLSFVASTKRWWALYANFGLGTNRYQAVERPFGRGLAAPYGHCTDGSRIYWWAKDGIWMSGGGQGVSLTDTDLYTLFPHEGENTPVNYTYAGNTIFAPDYKYSGLFRLAIVNGYLYADYRDSNGFARTLVCDVRDHNNPKWCPDAYGSNVLCHYGVEQQESTVLTTSTRYALEYVGDSAGNVSLQSLLSNDAGVPIISVMYTFEYNAGDIREVQLFNDAFLDFVPAAPAGISVSAVSGGVTIAGPTSFASSSTRYRTSLPIGQELKYMGIGLSWVDNFNIQTIPTTLFAWQPMYQGVPVALQHWKTQFTSFGLLGYKFIPYINFAYKTAGANPVTLTINVYDGTAPTVITLPATNGVIQKTKFSCTFNKGMLYSLEGDSTADWQPYLSETEIYVGQWNREGPLSVYRDLDRPMGTKS